MPMAKQYDTILKIWKRHNMAGWEEELTFFFFYVIGLFYNKHLCIYCFYNRQREPQNCSTHNPHKTQRNKKYSCELVRIYIKGNVIDHPLLFPSVLEFKVNITAAMTNGGRFCGDMMFQELCWRNSRAWGLKESLKSCLLLWCCVCVVACP